MLAAKPALLVWGAKDRAFRPGRFLPRMEATFPDREVVLLPGAGHYLQEDAPEQVAGAIVRRFGRG